MPDLKIKSLQLLLLINFVLLSFLGSLEVYAIVSNQILNNNERISSKHIPLTFKNSQPIEYEKIQQETVISGIGDIHLSTFYHVISRSEEELSDIEIDLPNTAFAISAYDAIGKLQVTLEEGNKTTQAHVNLRSALKNGEIGKFTIDYRLPWRDYVDQISWREYGLHLTFETENKTIRKQDVSVTLPEGAKFLNYSVEGNVFSKSIFQEMINFNDIEQSEDYSFNITYEYLIFWAAFRPTLWMGLVVLFVFTIAFFRQITASQAPILHSVYLDVLRSFVDAYEKKRRILLELEAVNKQAQSGKILRRQYRVRRRTLETSISAISRDLVDLREKLRKVDPKFSDTIREIEIAETELDGINMDIQRITSRYKGKRLSSEAYRKLLEEYQRRKERVEATIDGFLMRLQEETSYM
jgi:hypothetical protein